MSVAVIGNFDGVHLGHRKLLSEARKAAHRFGTEVVALTFEPHPRNFFSDGKGVELITPFALKKNLLLSCGADRVVPVRFDAAFSLMSAWDFLQWLKKEWGCSVLVCGENSHFGKGGRVSSSELLPLSEKAGMIQIIIPVEEDIPVSSSRIRDLLRAGKAEEASSLLGHPFSVFAPVVSGNQIGRTIGFPTLNQPFAPGLLVPPFGVYVSQAHWNGRIFPSVSNIGVKPTVGRYSDPLIETHLLGENLFDCGFQGDLQVDVLKMLRPERKFNGLDALQKQIALDCELAQKYLHTK